MITNTQLRYLKLLKGELKGALRLDNATRILYATDASAYRELPVAVAFPEDTTDVVRLVNFAAEHKVPLIPRGAGTSLAGQVVGNGIVVDVSRYMNRILEMNPYERWVRVEPGVVLDELNMELQPTGLFFGPETSTSNRCVIGGMVGNNSCGAHSLIYGSTREHTLEIEAVLSDGSIVTFSPLTTVQFQEKLHGSSLENLLYQNIHQILSEPENQERIRKEFPDPAIKRRNTGYAIDLLLETDPFAGNGIPFNFCTLLAGSEGTLAFITSVKLNLVPLPPPEKGLICVHFHQLNEAFYANLIALKYQPGAVELMDHNILEQTRNNLEQQRNRFFIQGNPAAILIIEFARDTRAEILEIANQMEQEMRGAGLGYHFPRIFGSDIQKVWALRKAGLGLLSNMPGDAKPVSLVEDTAVNPEVLPEYLTEFQQILDRYQLKAVYHAHIGSGELHLRPVLNLKKSEDVEKFYQVALETAHLVKKYRGSLSGEHGDGRLRGEFIPIMIGKKNYELLESIKNTWDPHHIFNPGKIVNTPSITANLRYRPESPEREIRTYFDFSNDLGFLRAVEKCNGSGDCRKSERMGGTMCPSFMATREEKDTTRARANTLREFITHSPKKNPFDHREIYEILDLCLSCKGCKSECPSSVDMARYKAEFLQHWYDSHGIPLRTYAIAYIATVNQLGMMAPALMNRLWSNKIIGKLIKNVLGFAEERSIPSLYSISLKKWFRSNRHKLQPLPPVKGRVYFFMDEFTQYNDTVIGIKAIGLLSRLGYEVLWVDHLSSGRTFLSKGMVKKAARLAKKNVQIFKDLVTPERPLVGVEPSAILTFRDEYPDLIEKELKEPAQKLAASSFMLDEFIAREADAGRITPESFVTDTRKILLHGHCHQKALASTAPTIRMLSLPVNYQVDEIPSGCCGMAGSFGYEKEHYELSMKIGELVLFPAIRSAPTDTIIAATGTSCRHQISDGTGVKALHPAEILYDALIH